MPTTIYQQLTTLYLSPVPPSSKFLPVPFGGLNQRLFARVSSPLAKIKIYGCIT